MLKFIYLEKLKIIIALIVFIKYSLWCLFLILQGNAINIALKQHSLQKELIFTLAGYILTKIIVMLCDVFTKFITDYYRNLELQQQWQASFPRYVYNDTKNDHNNINVLFFDYLPKIFDFKASTAVNNFTIAYIFSSTISAFLYSRFYAGISALIVIFALNYISKNIFILKIDKFQKETHYHKLKILHWVEQYFSSYREISKNWPGIIHSNWKDNIYQKYASTKNKQLFFYLYRDLLSQVLVELPFLINSSIIIIAVSKGILCLTQLFIWVGFSQFMIIASNAYLENRVNKYHLTTLNIQINDILNNFKPALTCTDEIAPIYSSCFSEIVLRDGSKNILSLKPGIHHVEGKNGSGKSTLLNIILDYEREERLFNNTNLFQLKTSFNHNNIRIIERDAVIFNCFDDFDSQIVGPLNSLNSNWKNKIEASLNFLLPSLLVKNWMAIFASLEENYIQRKNKTMSSGEKILLSMLRFISAYHQSVNLLIVDECDSFLDFDKKTLFIETIRCLASHMAIYITSHDARIYNDGLVAKTS